MTIVTPNGPPASKCDWLSDIRRYIRHCWIELRRSNADLLRAATDVKVKPNGTAVLYIPRTEDLRKIRDALGRKIGPSELRKIQLLHLPEEPAAVHTPGLLYLPYPYVVPGGRFNEMYGWDSYFILLGLLKDGELQLAKDMTANLVYEVEHYGKVLNANRTYYLDRSQPPFLTRMVLEVHSRTADLSELRDALPPIEKYYAYWTAAPHLTPQTGLSRYYGSSSTPAPEVAYGERDSRGRNEYDLARHYFRTHQLTGHDTSRYYDREKNRLSDLFYLGDRAMRESGFDPSGRFGPFAVDIISYNPVCLNCLLYRMEMDTSAIYTLLACPNKADLWSRRAERRAAAINRLMWNEQSGLYFDYDFTERRQSRYRFLTTFYPLWAGIATKKQASRVAANLPEFERAGGLQTSDCETGDQWDAPFGWAPLQLLAVQGLRRYGFNTDADRISIKFLSMLLRDFAARQTIDEKYDVVTGRSDISSELKFGYTTNEVGFGWTNAVFLVLYDELSLSGKQRLADAWTVLSGSGE